jgi:hypothetical protein
MATAVGGCGAIRADGPGLALLTLQLITAQENCPLSATAAAATSLARVILAQRSARQCLAIRSSLTEGNPARSG